MMIHISSLAPSSIPFEKKVELHADLFPAHAHHELSHLICREGGICRLDDIMGDLSFWDPAMTVTET